MEIKVGDYILREHKVEDASDLYEILGDKERSWWYGWDEPLSDLNNAHEHIEYCMEGGSSFGSHEEIELAIEFMDKVIGVISVSKEKDNNTAEFGYVIHKEYEGQSIMPLIVKALCKELFINDNINKLIISVMESNKRSWRVAEKCGFHKTEEIEFRMDGSILNIYNLSKEEFLSNLSKVA